jgi:hypothetical protein
MPKNLSQTTRGTKFTICFFCFFMTTLLKVHSQDKSAKITWGTYRINPLDSIETTGTIILSQNADGDIWNPLNLLILKNSELIFPGIKPNLNSEIALRKLFTSEDEQADNDNTSGDKAEKIEAIISFSNQRLLTYKIRMDYHGRDLLSPYIEYLNIDLEKNKLIKTKDIFDPNKRIQFNFFLNAYKINHKREIVSNYKTILSERIADQISDNEKTLYSPGYSLSKVHLQKTDTAHIINLQSKGIAFEVMVTDKNSKKYKSGNQYISYLFVPYVLLKPYFNPQSSLFKTTIGLCK